MNVVRNSIVHTLGTGFFTGLVAVIISVSYASLIFSGELEPFLGHGIALAIAGIVIVGLFQAVLSGSSYFVAQVDDDTAPVFVLFTGFLLGALPASLSVDQVLGNVLAAILIATLIAGATLAIVGYFKLGSLLQFLPYSAVGGYFAAVGWLLMVSTIDLLVPGELTGLSSALSLFDSSEAIVRWLPALLLAAGLRYLSSRFNTASLLALAILGSTLLFYLVAFSFGNDITTLQANGHLTQPLSSKPDGLFTPLLGVLSTGINFSVLLDNSASIATISLMALLSFTLCVSAIGLSARQELDPNRELKVAGLSNIIGALFGGLFALPSVSTSKLSYELHPAANKLVGLLCVATALLVFYLGLDLIAYIPKMVFAALLFYIALGFLIEWLVKGYRKFGALEYSVIPIILVVSIFSGFLESILFGIVAAIVLFAVNYSQTKVIKYQASGSELRSNLVRPSEQSTVLRNQGHRIRLFKLQGFLFFGTAGSLYREVMSVVEAVDQRKLEYIVLDFSQVLGVDSSATLNFERLEQRLKDRNVCLILTGLRQDLLDKLIHGGFDLELNPLLQEFSDIDQGLEWCENRILNANPVASGSSKGVLELIAGDLSAAERDHLETYFLKRSVQQGELLTDLGETANDVYFLETCSASAYILDSNNIERRVDGAGRGAIYGEIGFFLNIPRTAIVRADSDGYLYTLSSEALKRMESDEPLLAAAINRYMLKIVTERLASTTRSLRTVL